MVIKLRLEKRIKYGIFKRRKRRTFKSKVCRWNCYKRFEQIGIDSLEKLSNSSVEEITDIVSDILGSSCWKNSPQAKKAVSSTIEFAKENNQNAK